MRRDVQKLRIKRKYKQLVHEIILIKVILQLFLYIYYS